MYSRRRVEPTGIGMEAEQTSISSFLPSFLPVLLLFHPFRLLHLLQLLNPPQAKMTKSALLILDAQTDVVDQVGCPDAYVNKLAEVVERARRSPTIQVIFVTTSFRPGYPDIHSRSLFARIAASNRFVEGDPRTGLHPSINICDGDIFVTKKRVSAFSGSDLDLVLRSMEISHLVVGGITTSGAVLSTVRQAADLDYALVVLKDLCIDRDDDVHEMLTEKVFARQAITVQSAEWMANHGI